MRQLKQNILTLLLTGSLLLSCTYEKGLPDHKGYPAEAGDILLTKCATVGCHSTVSSDKCRELDLSSWDNLFKGSINNSAVVPFRADHSFLFHSLNTYHDLGPHLQPAMPLNADPLSRSEVVVIRDWINNGAPDSEGNIKWSGPGIKEVFVANQGCDYITVFDAGSKMIMRVIDVGNSSSVEAPHDMIVSPDGKYLYLSYFASSLFQRYNADNGNKTGEIDLGTISWHAIAISGNGRYAICSHFDGNGKIILLDLWNMSVVFNYQGSGLFQYPHGCAFNNEGTLAYVTCFEGNYLYKIVLDDPSDPIIEKVILQPGEIENHNGVYKPYEVDFCPDQTKYYVTCQGTNEVRVYNTVNDNLVKVVSTTGVPQLISFSRKHPYAFVTCIEDVSGAATQSSVNILNTDFDQLIKSVDPGYQPRGIAVDDDNECVWIANRNVNGLGITPHHSTLCEGNKGYVTLIDMSTLELKSRWKTEVGVDPYCIAIKP